MKPQRCRLFLLTALLLATGSLDAQQYSYDGNRWYEIEVIVLAHRMVPGELLEQPQPHNADFGYLPALRELRPAIATYRIDFEAAAQRRAEREAALAAAPTLPGPAKGPMLPGPIGSFRLDDFARDPFIALDARFHGLDRELTRLRNSPDHDVLYHRVWRQPMQGSGQTPALLVTGGAAYDGHFQLEGSMRFIDRDGRVHMDLGLWLNEFVPARRNAESQWPLPPLPLQDVDAEAVAGLVNVTREDWLLAQAWIMRESRALQTGVLHYLDNPAFGVLIELRPYVLPTAGAPEGETDF